MHNKKALLIIGSPKRFKSSSWNIGEYLLINLEQQGFYVETEHIGTAFRKETINELILKVNNADITVISAPLYVDSLPSQVIEFMELYRNDGQKKIKKLIGIVNSGFPEAFHNDTAIEILRLFALHNGFCWGGGFAIGSGGAFINVDFEKSRMVAQIAESFRESAIYISKGESIPQSTFEKASKPIMPNSIYLLFGQLGWFLQSIKYRTFFKLWAKPYLS